MNIAQMLSNLNTEPYKELNTELNTELSKAMKVLDKEKVIRKSVVRKRVVEVNGIRERKKVRHTIDFKDGSETKPEMSFSKQSVAISNIRDDKDISARDLQEAVIWSEILGEPVSKRRRNRPRGQAF